MRRSRATRPVLGGLAVLAFAALAAGCGGPPPAPDPTATSPAGSPPAPAELAARGELAARAAAAQDLVAVSLYNFTSAGHGDRTVMVVRAADGSWRVDIPGGALDGTADISIVSFDGELYHCALANPPQQAGCVPVDQLTEEIDPRVHWVFTDWLRVLTDRAAAVSVVSAPPLVEDSDPDTACFAVQPSAASLVAPIDAGVYCYRPDGTLTGAELELGTLTLVSLDSPELPSVDLPGPVVSGEPLPLVRPDDRPTSDPNSG